MRNLALISILCAPLAVPGADFPQWRGLQRDGVVDFTAPSPWPGQLKQIWKITVGEGHASPIYAGGATFAFARVGGSEVVYRIDPATGKVVWKQSYAAPYSMNSAATAHGEGPKSTPLFHGGRLYTLGISGKLSCWDASSGKLNWRKEFAGTYKETSPLFGTAMSPIIANGLLIAHVGGNDSGALTAFDAVTGAERWRWNGDGPAYASPVVATISGIPQLITQSQQNVIAVSLDKGQLLWKMPFTTPYVQNAVTPLVYGDVVILSGLENGIRAVRPVLRKNAWSPETVWHNKDLSLYMNSPVHKGDLLFGFSNRNRGQLFCLDLKTGKVLWTGPPRQGENAALLLHGDDLLVLKNDAELLVVRASSSAYSPVKQYGVADSPTWAHPLPLDQGVIVKDLRSLALWSWARN